MTFVDKVIHDLTSESDIAFQSDVYKEIAHELMATELSFAFFVFKTSGNSACGRTLGGNSMTCPALTLFLKYDADFQQTGIDPHLGNWNDKWAPTRTIRNVLNAILQRRGFDNDYVSDHTYIFVRTLEEIAFRELGRNCKEAVIDLVRHTVPDAEILHIFWNGVGYYVIMRDQGDCKRAKKYRPVIAKRINEILANADQNKLCRTYNASLDFGCIGMNLFYAMREDIG